LNPSLVIWVDEMISFPRGSNDDTLDSLCYAIQASQDNNGLTHIDWDRVPDLISIRKDGRERIRDTGKRYRNIIKV